MNDMALGSTVQRKTLDTSTYVAENVNSGRHGAEKGI